MSPLSMMLLAHRFAQHAAQLERLDRQRHADLAQQLDDFSLSAPGFRSAPCEPSVSRNSRRPVTRFLVRSSSWLVMSWNCMLVIAALTRSPISPDIARNWATCLVGRLVAGEHRSMLPGAPDQRYGSP
jgi:hypothetical protein